MPGRFLLSSLKASNETAMRGRGNAMYQKYAQYSELNRLIGAAAVSKRFRQTLLQNPEQVLEHGCFGYQFDLTTEEAALVRGAVAGDIHEFSLQVWEWMSCNGNGDGSRPSKKLLQSEQSLGDVFAGTPVSTAPVYVKEEKQSTWCPFPSNPTFFAWRDTDMDPLILVVDDNREMAEGLRFALETEGFQVALASDGESAVRFLEDEHPDLILADIKMPRMDGYALLHVVKDTVKWCDIPFVFVTAAADWREAVMAKSKGADEYIVKPFELEDLVQVVKRLTSKVAKAGLGVACEEKRTKL